MKVSKKRLKPDTIVSLVFTGVGILNAVIYLLFTHFDIVSSTSIGYQMLFYYFLAAWAPKIVSTVLRFNFKTSLLIAFEIFIYMAVALGSGWRLYDMEIYFDKFIHLVSGVMFVLICYNFYEQSKGNKLNLFWTFLVMFSFSMAVGGFWEICEFTADAFGGDAQKTLGFIGREAVYDTMFDLISDFVGAIAGAVWVVLNERKKRKADNISDENEVKIDEIQEILHSDIDNTAESSNAKDEESEEAQNKKTKVRKRNLNKW